MLVAVKETIIRRYYNPVYHQTTVALMRKNYLNLCLLHMLEFTLTLDMNIVFNLNFNVFLILLFGYILQN